MVGFIITYETNILYDYQFGFRCHHFTCLALQRSRSVKVTDFGTNRKPIYDFLLVINSNLPSILHRVQVMADYMQTFG